MKHTFLSFLSRVHRGVYSATGGALGRNVGTLPVLLLTTTGKKSKQSRTIPITYFRDGRNFAVVPANGGSEREPGWWINLKANPRGEIQIGKQRSAVNGREATPDETARIWPTLPSVYGQHQANVKRHIPIVMLEPVSQ